MIDPTVRRAVADDAGALRRSRTRRPPVASSTPAAATAGSTNTLRSATDGRRAVGERAVFVAVIPVDDVEVPVGYLVADLVTTRCGSSASTRCGSSPTRASSGSATRCSPPRSAWGRDGGAELVEGHALPGDRNIKNLYERAGVTARLITVSRRL